MTSVRVPSRPTPLSAPGPGVTGVTCCLARCRTGPRPAPMTSRWSPRCSGARTAWSTCGRPRWALPPAGTRASPARMLPGHGCHRLRLPPRYRLRWGEQRGGGLFVCRGSQERNQGADGVPIAPTAWGGGVPRRQRPGHGLDTGAELGAPEEQPGLAAVLQRLQHADHHPLLLRGHHPFPRYLPCGSQGHLGPPKMPPREGKRTAEALVVLHALGFNSVSCGHIAVGLVG